MRLSRFTLPLLASACFVAMSFVRVASAQTANVFYVSPVGRDGAAGTITDPWQTLAYAVAQLVAGDTLYIRGGTYTGAMNTIDTTLYPINSGTAAAPITISAYPGGLAASTVPGPRAGAEVVIIQSPGPSTFGIGLT